MHVSQDVRRMLCDLVRVDAEVVAVRSTEEREG